MPTTNPMPGVGQQWLNKKRQKKYTVLLLANMSITDSDMNPTVVYVDAQGNIWARRLSEWYEKFERVLEE